MQSHLLRKCTERETIKTDGETVQRDRGEATAWQRIRSQDDGDEEGRNRANWIIFKSPCQKIYLSSYRTANVRSETFRSEAPSINLQM